MNKQRFEHRIIEMPLDRSNDEKLEEFHKWYLEAEQEGFELISTTATPYSVLLFYKRPVDVYSAYTAGT